MSKPVRKPLGCCLCLNQNNASRQYFLSGLRRCLHSTTILLPPPLLLIPIGQSPTRAYLLQPTPIHPTPLIIIITIILPRQPVDLALCCPFPMQHRATSKRTQRERERESARATTVHLALCLYLLKGQTQILLLTEPLLYRPIHTYLCLTTRYI